jgi:hypothetical protein
VGLTAISTTEDAEEGVRAFLDKRDPRWRGRITSLRLDPCSARGLTVTIDSVVLK